MTDRPMDANATTEHPDEGLIHAWLDDALGAAEAERVAAHVGGCAECQARVAEARGLIAGASRIVAALDDVPAGERPGWVASAVAGAGEGVVPITRGAEPVPQRSLWRWLRVTPGRAALAATILVALGITLTHERLAEDSVRSVTATFDPQKADVPAATPAEPGASAGAKVGGARDEVLDSAIARNLAQTQGRARIEAAPGAALPQAPPPSVSLEASTGADRERVARVVQGRAAAEAQRETASVAADRLRVGNPTAVAAGVGAAEGAAGVAARRSAAAPVAAEGAMMAKDNADAVAKSCLRLESTEADARWGDQPFPLVISIDPGPASGPRSASVLTAAGQPTELRATWRAVGDSVSIVLRRIGYSGSIALGPEAGARSGTAVSATAPTALGEAVAVSPRAQTRIPSAGVRGEARRDAAAPQAAPAAGPPVRQLRVIARSIACPS